MAENTTKTGGLLSLTDAAKLAGVSRATLYRKLKSGELSATKRRDGSRAIDTAELVRVFGELQQPATSHAVASETPRDAPDGPETPLGQVEALKAQLEGLKRENELLRRELADAKNDKSRLLAIVEQKALPGPSWWDKLTGRLNKGG